MATLLTLVRLWALIQTTNGNCMVEPEGDTAALICGFVDGPYGYDDSAGTTSEPFPAAWTASRVRSQGSLTAAIAKADKCKTGPWIEVNADWRGGNVYTAICPKEPSGLGKPYSIVSPAAVAAKRAALSVGDDGRDISLDCEAF